MKNNKTKQKQNKLKKKEKSKKKYTKIIIQKFMYILKTYIKNMIYKKEYTKKRRINDSVL